VIPYFTAPSLPIVGPLAIHPFGVLVAIAVLLGTSFIGRRTARLGYDVELVQDFITRSLFTAFVSGHVFDQIFYHPEELVARPWSIVLLWEGLSSAGGFLGTFLGALHWSLYEPVPSTGVFPRYRRREKRLGLVPVTELTLHSFPFAWFVGRMGCAVAHDHLGALAPAGHWLAVAVPVHPALEPPFWSWHGFALYAGSQPRFDLGLSSSASRSRRRGPVACRSGRTRRRASWRTATCASFSISTASRAAARAIDDGASSPSLSIYPSPCF
jgi:phosphatidylglycerol:prolipoprotein diacylglycerol transferase